MKRTVFFLTATFLLVSVAVNAQDARQILAKVDQTVFAVKDWSTDVEMILKNLKTGKEKRKKAKLIQKGPDRKIFKYTYPKADSGIATLILPGNEVYLYLPMFKKPKKITNLAGGSAFNKTNFALQDVITKPFSQQFTPKLISVTEKEFKLALTPKNTDYPYGKIVLYVDKKCYCPVKYEYYDKKGEMVKVRTEHFTKVGNYWFSDISEMTDLRKDHATEIIKSNIKVNKGIKEDYFVPERLTE